MLAFVFNSFTHRVCARVCVLFLLSHGKISRCPLNQKVNPLISNTGSSKPVQWLTDPYSNCCSTPANKINLLFSFEGSCSSKLEKKGGPCQERHFCFPWLRLHYLHYTVIQKLKSQWLSKHTKIRLKI